MYMYLVKTMCKKWVEKVALITILWRDVCLFSCKFRIFNDFQPSKWLVMLFQTIVTSQYQWQRMAKQSWLLIDFLAKIFIRKYGSNRNRMLKNEKSSIRLQSVGKVMADPLILSPNFSPSLRSPSLDEVNGELSAKEILQHPPIHCRKSVRGKRIECI